MIKKTVKKQQPTPPGKKYTAKDSAQFVETEGRLKKNVEKWKADKYLDIDNTNLIKRQIDSLDKNPYLKTALQRASTKANDGGTKSTKVASKTKAAEVGMKKMMPKKK